MEFTGERVIPGQVDPDLWNEHLARYAFAARLAANPPGPRAADAGGAGKLRALDAGCGSGYGAAHLACLGPGVEVVGVDHNEEALAYAREHYAAPNLRFEHGDCLALSFGEGTFDLVVAFEVIEHLAEPAAFLGQARRVLAPSGRLVVSTPNRRYYSEERGYANPFHTREYDAAEFDALLAPNFPERLIFVQNHAAAVTFFPCSGSTQAFRQGAGLFAGLPAAGDQAHFLVAIGSREKLPPASVEPFVFVPSAANILREREQHIRKVEQDLATLQETTRRELDERKRWAEQQEAELAARDQAIRRLQAEHEETVAWAKNMEAQLRRDLEERTAWAQELDAERERLAGIVKELQAETEELRTEIESRVAWARSLEADLAAAREALARLQSEFDERTAWALRLDSDLAERTAWAKKLEAELEAVRADLRTIFGSRWYRVGKKLSLSPVPPSDQGRGSDRERSGAGGSAPGGGHPAGRDSGGSSPAGSGS